jgi:hypothetical protein
MRPAEDEAKRRRCGPVGLLATPGIGLVSPEAASVFDDFGWCTSRDLEWRCAPGRWDASTRIDGSDPARMVFVLKADAGERGTFLPRELACLHAFGLGLTGEEALAPWAIDVATDELHARRIEPRELLWLAADNMNALFWGLHDWAHFHNHGPFERGQRAWTELQCDTAALVWLWIALTEGSVDAPAATLEGELFERVRREVVALSAGRFASEQLAFDPALLAAERLQAMATRAMRS